MSNLSFFGRLMERVLIYVKEENDDDGESWMLLGVFFVCGTLFTIVFQGELSRYGVKVVKVCCCWCTLIVLIFSIRALDHVPISCKYFGSTMICFDV